MPPKMHTLIKVYAAFFPAGLPCRQAVEKAATEALGSQEDWLFLEGDILRISWEGIYFSLDEVLDALRRNLPEKAQGKLDYIDLEDWTLARYIFDMGAFSVSTRSLNHILEYSGH